MQKIIGYDDGQHFAKEQRSPAAKLPQQIRPEPMVTILPARTAQPIDKGVVNRLTKKIADLKIYISNSLALRSNRPTERFEQAAWRSHSPAIGANAIKTTCYNCGEEGHYS